MAVKLGLSGAHDFLLEPEPALDRRRGDRRNHVRVTKDRRRTWRRTKLRHLIFTSLALAAPNHLKHPAVKRLSGPRVSTTIDSVIAVLPQHVYEGLIREAAALYRVDAALIRSIMQAESAFDPSAVSRAGAMGLMQLMPNVADAFGVEDPFDPRENVMAGARLLRMLLDQQHGNVKLAVASYNAGPTAVADYGGVPPFRETQGYVKKVTDLIAAEARRSGDND